ncbi:GIY-YIG nuclease family protein [Fulvivirga sp.]|uniref:GIY-YIG nuclease family protein n=1 Tax=Fulvivirga sp. TaxID=1931237 RepID=UPI0032EBB526
MYTVYIIANKNGLYYKGFTTNILQRLEAHNSGMSNYTFGKGPWELIFIKTFEDKSDALKFEKMLKRQNKKYLDWLIQSDKNELAGGRLG